MALKVTFPIAPSLKANDKDLDEWVESQNVFTIEHWTLENNVVTLVAMFNNQVYETIDEDCREDFTRFLVTNQYLKQL